MDFHVHCDAFNIPIGAVLAQNIHGDRDSPIHYANRFLNSAEKNYSTTEREALAMIYSVGKFRHYLLANHFFFYVDHQALIYLVNRPVVSGRIARWMLLLQEYEFEVVYKSGRRHLMADHLSRIESEEEPLGVDDQFPDASLFMVHVQPFEDWRTPFIEYLTHRKLLSVLATSREHTKIRQLSEPFILDDEKLKRISISGKIHECIAGDIIEEIISEAYKQDGIHYNLTSTWHYILRISYWWHIRRRDVLEYCQECPVCKIANKREEIGNPTPQDFDDDDDPLPVKPLEAQEDMTGKAELDWTTPYVQYLTYGTQWESALPKDEKKLVAYCSQFFILKEGELYRIFHNNVMKKCMPRRYVRSYIKTLHIQENRHYSINATKQIVLQRPYWWPTIAEDISILITLCTECEGQGEELPTEVNLSKSSNGTDIIPYKETFNDWRTPLVEYMAHGKFKIDAETQRGQREIIRESENFTLEKGKLQKLERNGMTKICIAGYQIKHWIGKMHVYQQRHLNDHQTWLLCSQGNQWWPTMGLCDIQIYIMYDCPSCRG